jgi:hypothetical protein
MTPSTANRSDPEDPVEKILNRSDPENPLDNAMTQLSALQASFYTSGVPTALTIALMQIAPVGLP